MNQIAKTPLRRGRGRHWLGLLLIAALPGIALDIGFGVSPAQAQTAEFPQDLDGLDTPHGHLNPRGIWSDGEILWLADLTGSADALRGYNIRTKARAPTYDINTLFGAGNTSPRGVWSDGRLIWVADEVDNRVYAYNLETKAYDASGNFALAAGNSKAWGIWSDGTTMWVANNGPARDDRVFAYNLQTKAVDASKNFRLDNDNFVPTGIWSDGETMWVANDGANTNPPASKLYAYTLADGTRDADKDFDSLGAAGNIDPDGLWSDGQTMWVVDSGDDKIYAYNMQTRQREMRPLASISVGADASVNVTEGVSAMFTVNLDAAATSDLTVSVMVSQVGNVVPANQLGERMVAIAMGERAGTLMVATDDDNTDEETGRIIATVGADPNGAWRVNGARDASVNVTDNEAPPLVVLPQTVSASDTVDEVVFTISLRPADMRPVTGAISEKNIVAVYSTVADTAIAGVDYTPVNNALLTFAPGSVEARITIDIIAPDADDDVDRFSVEFLSLDNADYADGRTATTVRLIELPVVAVTAADTSVNEGEDVVFTISSTEAASANFTVEVTVAQSGDFVADAADLGTRMVTIPRDASTTTLVIPTEDDDIDEDDGRITATISALPGGGHEGVGNSATVGVHDLDGAPTISIADTEAEEGEVLNFPVRLSNRSALAITVNYATADGSATAGADYQASSGTLTLPAFANEGVIAVATYLDEVEEPDETVVVILSMPSAHAALAAAPSAVGRITRRGLSAQDIDRLNAAVTPYLAAGMNSVVSRITHERITRGFADNQSGLSLEGANGLLPYIAARAGGGRAHAAGGDLDAAMAAMDWGRTGRRSYSRVALPQHGEYVYAAGHRGGAAERQTTFSLWGQRYYQRLDVDAEQDAAQAGGAMVSFDGDIRGGMVGLDTVVLDDVLLGVGFNRVDSELAFEYTHAGRTLSGLHTLALSGAHPYFGIRTDEGAYVWGGVGLDRGTLEVFADDAGGERGTEPAASIDVGLHSVRFGGDGPLYVGDSARVGLVGDFAFARMVDTDAEQNGGFVVNTRSGRARLGLDVDAESHFESGLSVQRDVEMVLRHDYGDGLNGSGVEVGGGLRIGIPATGLRAGLAGRGLLSHSNELEDWGVAADLAWSPRRDERGLSVAFKPQWGDMQSAAGSLWAHGMAARQDRALPAARYGLEVKYGLALSHEAESLTLFARGHVGRGGRYDGHALRYGTDYRFGERLSAGYEVAQPNSDRRGYLRYRRRF